MKRLLLILALLTLSSLAMAQAFDFELGYELRTTGERGAYGLARYNLPLGDALFGAQTWLLPEAGVFLGTPLEGYGRLQLLIDTTHVTLFGDCRLEFTAVGRCRVGARFGIP